MDIKKNVTENSTFLMGFEKWANFRPHNIIPLPAFFEDVCYVFRGYKNFQQILSSVTWLDSSPAPELSFSPVFVCVHCPKGNRLSAIEHEMYR